MRRFSSAQISATCHNACNDLKSTTGKVVMSASTKVQSQAHKPDLPVEVDGLLAELRVGRSRYKDGVLKMRTPITGETIGQVQETSASEAIAAIEAAHTAFRAWRLVPAPKRGELVRLLGEELRAKKEALGRLVSIEVGKIVSEGLGEQEMIDICDFAVGLSRQLYGLTIATERGEHRMMESWHPLGVIIPRRDLSKKRPQHGAVALRPLQFRRPTGLGGWTYRCLPQHWKNPIRVNTSRWCGKGSCRA